MATDEVARLVAVVEANLKGFTKGMDDMRRISDKQFGALQRQMRQSERGFSALGGTALSSLIRRYTAWGFVVGTLTRAMQTAAKTNTDAAKATAELNRAWNEFAQSAAIVLTPVISASAKLLSNIAAINKELLNGNTAGAFRKFQESTSVALSEAQRRQFERAGIIPKGQDQRFGGIPFASAGNIPDSVEVTKSKLDAFATNDQLEEAKKRAKEKADIEAGIVEHYAGVKQHFLDEETKAVEAAAAIEEGIRQHYFDVQQSLWETEADELADIHQRMNQAWDEYYERQAESAENASDTRLQAAQEFFGSLATLTRSSSEELKSIGKAAAIIEATINGVLAVQRALKDYPYPISLGVAAAVGAAAAVNVAEIAGMEKGGRVSAGTPYIVGEKRAELFVPDTAGRIIPRVPNAISPSGIGSSSVTNAPVFNIDARGAQAGVADQITAALRQFERNFPRMMVKAQRDSL